MKFALHSVSYSGTWGGVALPFEEFLDRARSFGYQAVEVMAKRPHISPVDYGDADQRKRLADLIRSKGLEVACIADYHDWCWDGAHRDMPHHEKELLWLQANCQLAADLHCPFVRTFSGYVHPGVPYRQQWDDCVKYLREGAELAKGLGVTVLLQPHQGFTVRYQDALRMLQEVDHPNLRMQLDPPYVHHVGAPMGQAVADCLDWLEYSVMGGDVFRDTVVTVGTGAGGLLWQRMYDIRAVPLEEAEEDISGFLAALKKHGYQGRYIGFEVCGPPLLGDSLEVVDDIVARSLRFLEETWNSA